MGEESGRGLNQDGLEEGDEEEDEEVAAAAEDSGDEDDDDDESAGDDDGEDRGQKLGPDVVSALVELCNTSPAQPIAAGRISNDNVKGLASVLLRAKVPDTSWPEVCSLLTQLCALG